MQQEVDEWMLALLKHSTEKTNEDFGSCWATFLFFMASAVSLCRTANDAAVVSVFATLYCVVSHLSCSVEALIGR